MRLYIILRIKLETLQKKKKLHQFKILYFSQRPWAFNHHNQKARNFVVLCTIDKSRYMCKKE